VKCQVMLVLGRDVSWRTAWKFLALAMKLK